MNNFFSLLLLVSLFGNTLYAKQPSEKKIKSWLTQDNFSIKKVQSVYLLDNERAYLAEVDFFGEDPVLKEGLVLVRPELEEAEFIPPFPKNYIVTDLDHDGVSEVIFSQKHIYDTYSLYKRYIIQLHEYQRFKLHTAEYKEQTKCSLCLIEDIQWEFEDLTHNKIKDLRQDYILQIQGKHDNFIFKENIQEVEFNKEGFRVPFRPSDLQLSSIKMSKDVIDREPVSTTQVFDINDEKVFCYLDFKDVESETKVTYHWIHETLGKVLSIEQNIHPAARFRTWLYKSLHQKKKYLGDWVVIITDKYMNILASNEFSITQKDKHVIQ